VGKTYHAIVDLGGVVSSMCDALTDEKLDSCSKATRVPVSQLRVFWMDFVFSHLVNTVGCEVDKLKDGALVSAHSFIDLYTTTLKSEFSERDFDGRAEMVLGRFGVDFVLPTLAELISPELKNEVLEELDGVVKQAV